MSFMEHQVLGYKSPLYGRRTAQFKILPFDLWDSAKMLPGFTTEEQAILYGVTGGVPEYLHRINNNYSLRQNIIELFFDSSGRLYEEPGNLLKQELRSPASYNAILSAIASGHSKLNEIATKVGIPTGACSNLITSLIELGIVIREVPTGTAMTKKSIYKIGDQMFRFWYQFVSPNQSMITAGFGEETYDNLVESNLPHFMGEVFEIICKDYMLQQNALGNLPLFFSEIGHWWGGNPKTKQQEEIDLLAIGQNAAILGECKWKNRQIGREVLEKAINRMGLFVYAKKYIYLFSKCGFTEECEKEAEKQNFVKLISFEDMWKKE